MSQAKPIQILPEFIANQIAAGEVVQRPESVIKELVENSFDAGADTIMVVVKEAGKQLIHIVDNGYGMSKSDLALACRRHATSKVYDTEDLEAIRTFGFRGEALASIASVANIEIRTTRNGEPHGWKLTAEPMKTEIIEPFAIENGTQIFVRNLFYNIPVRKKFLRTNLTEFRYISDTMIKFALSKPNIRFIFYDEDTLIFDAKPSNLRNRISQIIGESTANSIIPVNHSQDGIQVFGYIGLPSIAKQSKSNQYLFLNDRSIQSKSISHAVFSAYEHLLEKSKHPFFVLNIQLDYKKYDVNVHPQKHEVKFDDEKLIYNLVHRAVVRALAENNIVQDTALQSISSLSPFERVVVENESNSTDILLVNKSTGEIVDQKPNFANDNFQFSSNNNYNSSNSYRGNFNNASQYIKPPLNFDVNIFNHTPSQTTFANTSNPEFDSYSSANSAFNAPISSSKEIELLKRFVSDELNFNFFQIHSKYLIFEIPTGVLLADQHAAHERILYEKAIKKMNKLFANSQQLLFPQVVNLSLSEITVAQEIREELEALGYEFELTENGAIVKSIPLDDAYNHETILLNEIIEQYIAEQKIRHSDKRDYLAASFACKAAIKTGQRMSKAETMRLFQDLLKCEMPYCCPHGRPIVIELSLYQLDKLFGRII